MAVALLFFSAAAVQAQDAPAEAAGSGDMPAYYMMGADEAGFEPEPMPIEEIDPGPADSADSSDTSEYAEDSDCSTDAEGATGEDTAETASGQSDSGSGDTYPCNYTAEDNGDAENNPTQADDNMPEDYVDPSSPVQDEAPGTSGDLRNPFFPLITIRYEGNKKTKRTVWRDNNGGSDMFQEFEWQEIASGTWKWVQVSGEWSIVSKSTNSGPLYETPDPTDRYYRYSTTEGKDYLWDRTSQTWQFHVYSRNIKIENYIRIGGKSIKIKDYDLHWDMPLDGEDLLSNVSHGHAYDYTYDSNGEKTSHTKKTWTGHRDANSCDGKYIEDVYTKEDLPARADFPTAFSTEIHTVKLRDRQTGLEEKHKKERNISRIMTSFGFAQFETGTATGTDANGNITYNDTYSIIFDTATGLRTSHRKEEKSDGSGCESEVVVKHTGLTTQYTVLSMTKKERQNNQWHTVLNWGINMGPRQGLQNVYDEMVNWFGMFGYGFSMFYTQTYNSIN